MAKATISSRDFKAQARNANKGTARGNAQIRTSLKNFGAGRSICVDKNDLTIAGSHVLEGAQEIGMPVRVVETDGRELVVVRRTDLDLNKDPRAVQLAYADNRTSQVGLEWDAEVIAADIAAGIDLTDFFRDADEISKIIKDQEKSEVAANNAIKEASDGGPVLLKLPMTAEQHQEFLSLSMTLIQQWGVTDSTTVVLEAMRKATRG